MAGLGGGFAGILGNGVLQQIFLYNVAGGLLGAAFQPFGQAIANALWADSPVMPLSAPEAAQAVIRNLLDADTAAKEAAASGFSRQRFDVLTGLAGQSLGAGDLAIALRRKIIDEATFLRGVRQGNTRDEWADTIKALAVQQPSPEAMLAAYLEGQLERDEALQRYIQLGGDPGYFDILYNTQGQAPTPTQALDLLNRGIIGEAGRGANETSYEQAFLEGPWRNKWLEPFLALRRYLPPPRTITAMYKEGSYTQAEAAALLKANGLVDSDIAAYLASGAAQQTATTKDLSQSVVTTLYLDRILTRPQALSFLQALGYDQQAADYILEVQDLQLVQKYLELEIGRIHTYYVARKINDATAQATLAQLGLDASNVTDLLTLWGYERAANVKLLSPTDVATAYKRKLLDEATALSDLAGLGYQPHDAWVYLSVHGLAAGESLSTPEPPRGTTTPTGG